MKKVSEFFKIGRSLEFFHETRKNKDDSFYSCFWLRMTSILINHPKTTSLLLGLLLTLALPPYYFYPFAILAFSVFFWLINRIEGTKKICAAGYFFGFGFFAGGFYWIGNALLIDLARTGWLYPLTLFLNGAFFGIFTILPALGGTCPKLKSITARMFLFLPNGFAVGFSAVFRGTRFLPCCCLM